MSGGDLVPGTCNHHGNVVRRIMTLPNVERILSIGQRGYTLTNQNNGSFPKLDLITASKIRREGTDQVLELLPPNAQCYISLDIDVLDPVYAPGTSTPVPGGLLPDEALDHSAISSASVMVPCPWFPEVVEYATRHEKTTSS
jgi:arginase family enzyme